MTKKPLKIIGINPGTRYLGIAVFDGPELMDWRIKVLDGKWSNEKIKKAIGIVSEFICQYKPNALAIKKLHPSRRSENLLRLVNKIKEFSRREEIKVYQYSIKEVENLFIEDRKMNKQNLAEIIVSGNPALFYEFQKEKSNRNSYHIRMIEAVALASICLSQFR